MENQTEYEKMIAKNRESWTDFYRKHFSEQRIFTRVLVPPRPEGRWKLQYMYDIEIEKMYQRCRDLFPGASVVNENPRNKKLSHDRDARKGKYAIWLEDVFEVETMRLTVTEIKISGVVSETLPERIIQEIRYADEKFHLDMEEMTICAGTWDSRGFSPVVGWQRGKFLIHWVDGKIRRYHYRTVVAE